MQEDELVGVQWMPLEEYLAVPFTATRPLYRQIHAVCVAYANGTYRCVCFGCGCGGIVSGWAAGLHALWHSGGRVPAWGHAWQTFDGCLTHCCFPVCLCCSTHCLSRGLAGRKLETGFSPRQDLLLFGEAAEQQGADQQAQEDAWIGLEAAEGAAAAGDPGAAALAAGGAAGAPASAS